MPRLTVALPDDLDRALKLAAARRGQTIDAIVARSLRLYGIKTERRAGEIVAEARRRSGLTEQEALSLAADETNAARSAPAPAAGDASGGRLPVGGEEADSGRPA